MSGKRYSEEEVRIIKAMYAEGYPIKSIAEALGRSYDGVNNVIYRTLELRRFEKPAPEPKANTLCWSCANSCDYGKRTCEWSRSFEPVPGWDAIPNSYHDGQYQRDSYTVRACPKFIRQNGMDDVERQAIRANTEQEPFYRLLAAIYRGMAEEYRSCVETILSTGAGREKRDEACSRFIYLEDYFKGTGAEPILHGCIRNRDLLDRYIDSYKWRHKIR